MNKLPYSTALKSVVHYVRVWPDTQAKADAVTVSVQGWDWVYIPGLQDGSWEFQSETGEGTLCVTEGIWFTTDLGNLSSGIL